MKESDCDDDDDSAAASPEPSPHENWTMNALARGKVLHLANVEVYHQVDSSTFTAAVARNLKRKTKHLTKFNKL